MDEKKNAFLDKCRQMMSWVMNLCVFIIVSVFPLIFHDAYYDILIVKYQCYYLCVLVSLAMILILAAVMFVFDRKNDQGIHTKQFLNRLHPSNWKRTFRMADAAVLLFWITVVISTFQSDYFYESFWGNEGRYSGLFLITLYVVAYFLVSRLWKFKPWAMQVFLICGMIICLIGVGDYFQLDPLRFRVGFKPDKSEIFTSTIGNINVYTAYVALLMGFAAAMFATEKKRIMKAWYYVCMLISFFAIVMGCSDNAYLALGALFGLSPFVLFRNYDGIRKYLIMLASFFSVIQCIVWINERFSDMVIGLDSLFRVMAAWKGLSIFVLVLWALVILSETAERKVSFDRGGFAKRCLMGWSIFVLLCILVVCFTLYDANVAGNAARYSALGNYLIFDDAWGTYRGYIWKACMRLYQEFPLMRKLFGFGPETLGILTITEIKSEMIAATGYIYDNAHNEYLQYLLTLGAVGLITYLFFLFTVCRNMYQRSTHSGYMMGLLWAVVCYCTQALVNLNLPMVAPIMWLMLSMGMSAGFDDEQSLDDHEKMEETDEQEGGK